MSQATNVVDLAVELLNDAKLTKDSKSKLYFLEQVKEIVLFRDTSILLSLISEIVSFSVEASVQIRRFLINFVGAAFSTNQLVAPHVLSLFNFYCSDSSSDLIRNVAVQLHPIYAKLLIYIANQKKTSEIDPKEMWNQLTFITSKVIESVSHPTVNESTKLNAIYVIESIIEFGIPPVETAKVIDPRLKAAKKKDNTSSTEMNCLEIPLHHTFLNRDEIIKEAESLFTKTMIWANKGGPQGAPLTPNCLSQLAQTIVNISSTRSKHMSSAVSAVIALVDKPTVCEKMSASSREHLARAFQRLIRSLTYQSDATLKSLASKLKPLLTQLETLGFADKDNKVVADGKGSSSKTSETTESSNKRPSSSMLSDETAKIEGEDEEEIAISLQAKEALKSAEIEIANKRTKLDPLLQAQNGSNAALGNFQGSAQSKFLFSATGDTELSATDPLDDVLSVPETSKLVGCITIDPRSASRAKKIVSYEQGEGLLCFEMLAEPSGRQTDEYALVHTATLVRQIEALLSDTAVRTLPVHLICSYISYVSVLLSLTTMPMLAYIYLSLPILVRSFFVICM